MSDGLSESRLRAGSERGVARICFAAVIALLGVSTLEVTGVLGGDSRMKGKIERALREFRRTAGGAVRFGDEPEETEDD